MKYKRFMYRFFQTCSAILFLIAALHVILKDDVQSAILAVVIAIHMNMLSWNYESNDEEFDNE